MSDCSSDSYYDYLYGYSNYARYGIYMENTMKNRPLEQMETEKDPYGLEYFAAAVRTLLDTGYTYNRGAKLWKPPVRNVYALKHALMQINELAVRFQFIQDGSSATWSSIHNMATKALKDFESGEMRPLPPERDLTPRYFKENADQVFVGIDNGLRRLDVYIQELVDRRLKELKVVEFKS